MDKPFNVILIELTAYIPYKTINTIDCISDLLITDMNTNANIANSTIVEELLT